jgi:hypothetical protein
MMLVQEFLATHSLAALREMHGVNCRVSERDPCVFTLNYDQIRVKNDDPLACQCRGLVLRAERDVSAWEDDWSAVGATTVLARPFDRFFNLGQVECAPVDFTDAVFFEKLDGTFCIVYEDRGAWHVATRGTPDADVPIDGNHLTFRGLFELALADAYGHTFGEWVQRLAPGTTYLFELTSAENQIVVAYPERKVTLLGARAREDGYELHLEDTAVAIGVDACPSHVIGSDDAAAWVATRDPAMFEGLVVRDGLGRRCKVKHPGYLALNHLAFQRSPRAMMRAILAGKDDDAERVLPEYMRPKLRAMRHGLGEYLSRLDAWFDAAPKADRKTLALAIQAAGEWMPCHMARMSGKATSAAEYVQSLKRDGDWVDGTVDHLLEKAGV